MKINISIASRDRFYGKAMRRISPAFRGIATAAGELELTNPGFSNLLIGLTDDPAVNGAKLVFVDSDTRQILIGLGAYSRSESDDSLLTRCITGMIEAMKLIDIEDEADFRELLSVFESIQNAKS